MCEGSMLVNYRQATDKERLVVRKIPNHRIKGYYPADMSRPDDRLVCVRGDSTKAVIKIVSFEAGLPSYMYRWQGQSNVEVTLFNKPYLDAVIFPDGTSCMLSSIKEGVRIDIGYPVHAEAMKVVEASITEALALPPDPKPEGEADAPSSEPPAEPQVNPVKEDPAPAREPETSRSYFDTLAKSIVAKFS